MIDENFYEITKFVYKMKLRMKDGVRQYEYIHDVYGV